VIEGKFNEMQSIASKDVHGNEGVNAKERTEAVNIAGNVRALWQRLYDAQRKEVLYWPKLLGEQFLKEIESKKFDQPITNDNRITYLNYIKNRFDALVEIVQAQKMPENQVGGGVGPVGRMEAMPVMDPTLNQDYLVQWMDQPALQAKLTWTQTPTSRQIWVTQEDLWVYETLLKAIANTNKERGASRPDNSAIRVIVNLEVGQTAALASQVPGNILMAGGAAADQGGALGPEGGGSVGRPAEFGGPMGEGGASAASIDDMLLQSRYVDAEGKPIADTAAATAAGAEYRRLPVRMVFMMEQKWIPRILVQCANAPLPIEVKRLRINPEESGAGFDVSALSGPGAGAAGPGMYGGRGEASAMGRPMGMGGPGMYGGRGGEGRGMMGGMSSMSMPTGPEMKGLVQVEIQGWVYIFNPPDTTVLTVPGAEPAPTGNNLAANEVAVK
jgi:hypothetical protein